MPVNDRIFWRCRICKYRMTDLEYQSLKYGLPCPCCGASLDEFYPKKEKVSTKPASN